MIENASPMHVKMALNPTKYMPSAYQNSHSPMSNFGYYNSTPQTSGNPNLQNSLVNDFTLI